jgi:hypothetical protein
MENDCANVRDTENIFMQMYLDTLSKKEYASYLIAKSHLGSSFQLEKSNGYIQWKKTLPVTTKLGGTEAS